MTDTATLESKAKTAAMRAYISYQAAWKLYLNTVCDERSEREYRDAAAAWYGIKRLVCVDLQILTYDQIEQIETDLAWER